MLFDRSSWTSYIISGGLALCASWLFSGCRFGNNTEAAPAAAPPYSYYAMAPSRLILCVLQKGDTSGNCAETTLDKVTEWQTVLTNPIVFYQPDKTDIAAGLYSKDLKHGIPIRLDSASASTFIHYSYTSPSALFHHTECVEQTINYGEGSYNNASNVKAPDGSSVAGNIEYAMRTDRVFTGTCDASLQELMTCYKAAPPYAACGMSTGADNQAEHDWAFALFEPYVDRGLMVPDDIPNITSVYYQFNYQ